MHNTSFAYKVTSTESEIIKEGDDYTCTVTKKYFFNEEGLKKVETEHQNAKTAMEALDKEGTITKMNECLAEIAAAKA